MAAEALIAGTVLNMFGTAQESQAQRQQLENQAVALERRAQATMREGGQQAQMIRAQEDEIQGKTMSAAAGSGVEVSTGSVLDTIKDTAFNIEMDAQTAMSNAASQADALRTEAAYTRAAKPSGASTLLGMAGQGLTGFAQYKMFQG